MLKQLLLGSFILAAPHPSNAITRPVYVEATFNKQEEQEYITKAGPSATPYLVTYANYTFNTNDDRQKIQGTIDTRTTNIYTTEFRSSSYSVTCKALSITEINNNNYQYTADITATINLTNINQENLQRYYIVWYGVVDDLESTTTGVQTGYNLSLQRNNQAYQISTQLDNIFDYMEAAEIYGDSYYYAVKADDPAYFNQHLPEAITNLKQHFTLDYLTENTPQQNKTFMFRYIELEYKLDTNYTNLTDTTINSYKNLLKGYNENIKYQVTYQSNAEIHTDVIDIPGLLFTILGMPFAWISTAFNLTLFPGTPYAVNVATMVMSIIGLLIAIFIIRRLIK